MEIGMFALIAVLGLGFLLLIGFDINTKAKLNLAKIQLERDKIALEQKKLELGRKNA
ncbi:hypothetical protein QWY16_03475 [Planococcus shenhongbingii]|uniref:hypothetical protein n=1 Tax=Planococcus shenhongbingii TaxID=3058398 RepID=UPI002602D414|nr:hypothetical protein [Planococcus sp. N016]WKA59227.1 hypothetical protein QWY16_03475 [Planococcus sp. N016]